MPALLLTLWHWAEEFPPQPEQSSDMRLLEQYWGTQTLSTSDQLPHVVEATVG
jgi:hypothetical protein